MLLLAALFANSKAQGWMQKTDFGGTARLWAVGFSIGEKGYIGTGNEGSSVRRDFWEYDKSNNSWTQKNDFDGTARHIAVGFSIGEKGYIGTGDDGSTFSSSKDFWEYDPSADSANAWTRKTDFGGSARRNAVGFSIGERGYIGTGIDNSRRRDFWQFGIDPPMIPASNVLFTDFAAFSLSFQWTNGDGERRIVLMRKDGAVDAVPQDSTTYSASTTFGAGSQIGSGNYVVFNGTGNSVTVGGLNEETGYHVAVFEYNGLGGFEMYLTTNPATGNGTTTFQTSFDGPGGVGSKDGTTVLDLWLKADSGVTTSGSSVDEWADQSGNGNHATQETLSNRPTHLPDSLNGKPVIHFDGSDDYLQTGSIPAFDADLFSWFLVAKSSSDAQVYLRSNYTSGPDLWGSFMQSNLFISHAKSSLGSLISSENTYNTSFNIIAATWSSGNSVIQYLNGTAGTTGSGANASPGGHQFTRVGANTGTTPDAFMNGDMAEVIVFTADLNAAQRILIENYLSAKYGLPLETNIKYSGYDPAYTISVAGIGREASGMHTRAHSDGLILRNIDALTADGGYFMAGHAFSSNSLVTDDLPEGIAERWERLWYLKKSNSDGAGSLFLVFDHDEGGLAGSPILSASDYRLLHRGTSSGQFSVAPTTGVTVTDDRVWFEVDESGLSDGYYTIARDSSRPFVQASDVFFTVIRATSLSFQWTNGDGEKRIVLMRKDEAVDAVPQDSTTYQANTTFGIGSQIGSGNYAVFSDAGNSVTVGGLNPESVYHVAVFEFNGSGGSEKYLTTGPATGNATTLSHLVFDGPGGVGSKDGTSVLDLWLKADSGVTTSGSSVSEWADQSGNGNNATAPGNAPTLQPDTLNGKPVVRFIRDNSQYLQTGAIASFNTDVFSWFMVVKSTALRQVYLRSNYTSNTSQWGSFTESSLFKSHARDSGGTFKGSENTYNSEFNIIGATWNSGDLVIQHLNGTAGTTGTEADASPSGHQFTRIGANSGTTPDLFMDGDMAEIIVFTTDLKPVQRILIENYLSAKYGLPLETNIKYTGYDSAYTISVAGIGREASGSHTEAHSDGLIFRNVDALTSDGEYFMAGHGLETNAVVSIDLPGGIADRWERSWYVTKTGSDSAGALQLGFDFDRGIGGSPALESSEYRLLTRSGTTGDFSVVTTVGVSVSGNVVTFNVAEVEISDGYYTIGLVMTDPLTILNNGPGGVGRTDGLSKLKLWLKADAGVSGSSVSEWADQSGSLNNAAQASSTNQPSLQMNVLNGRPVIRFDGTDDYLQTGSIPSFDTDVFTWFLVLQSTNSTQIYLRSRYTPPGNVIQWGSFTENNLFQSHARDTAGVFKGSQNAWNPSFNIISAIWNSGDSVTQYLNGVDSITATGANVVPSGHEFTRIGANSGATPSGFMDGYIAEIVVFTSDLNSARRILIENYLSAKYALTLTANVKYSGHDPAYTISVAGIGREASGSHTEANSDGLILRDVDALTSDGEYLMAGHASATNSLVTGDLPSGVNERWERVWYLKKSNADSVGSLLLVFDYDQGGLSGSPALDAPEYRLMYRSGTSGALSVVATPGNVISDAQVGFQMNEWELLDGYYTIGSSSNDPLPVQIASFTAIAKRLNAELKWKNGDGNGKLWLRGRTTQDFTDSRGYLRIRVWK